MTATRRPRRAGARLAMSRFNVFGYTFGFVAPSACAHQLLYRLYGAFVVDEAETSRTPLASRRAGQARPMCGRCAWAPR